ncbi:MAG: nucleotidyltransferase domain-containing protein, partial [Prevotella sp.]|nr:nucleotidyltransferase domain-containing protein [Prevotella sp.]
LRIYNDIDDLGLLYKVDLLHYEEKRGTPIGEHIDRAGKVFYQQRPHY